MTETTKISIGFHKGNIISYLSQFYGNPYDVIRELIQNALDEEAKNISVEINVPRRIIRVFDDGNGASLSEISVKFSRIGESFKRGSRLTKKYKGKLERPIGEKGIGNLAGIAIAQRWQLITKEKGSKEGFRLYELDKDELANKDDVNIHSESFPGKDITRELWFKPLTVIRLFEVDKAALARFKNLEEVSRVITNAFNQKIKNNNVDIRINYRDQKGARLHQVKPIIFRGTKLDPVKWDTPRGEITFQLWLSSEPLKEPKLHILHQGVYSFPLINLFKLGQLDRELEKVWLQGYVEGTILLGFGTLNPQRYAFQLDKELEVFANAFKEFTGEKLEPIISLLEKEERKERYYEAGRRVLKQMRKFFKLHPSLLPDRLKSFISLSEKENSAEAIVSGRFSKKKPKRIPEEIIDIVKRPHRTLRRPPQKKSPSQKGVHREKAFIIFVYPDENEGFNWHSRTADGCVEINTGNDDFRKAELAGLSKLVDYVALLVWKEFTCSYLSSAEAKIFSKDFEEIYMRFWESSLS